MNNNLDLMDILGEDSIAVKWDIISRGLKQPENTGEYKYAKYLLQCMIIPPASSICSIALILLMLILMPSFSHESYYDNVRFEVTIIEPTKTDLEQIKPEEELTPPEEMVIDNSLPDNLPPGPVTGIISPVQPSEYSSNPDNPTDGNGVGGDLDVPVVPFAPVMTKSPLILKGIYGNRAKGGRELAMKAFGGGGGSGNKSIPTEDAVLRALRWLKKYQESDGSWNTKSGGYNDGQHFPSTPAMTGLALLTYLAHGETPSSDEFGPTVERAIRYLVESQEKDGRFTKRDDHDYSQPIASYALCEAFGMTQVPMVKDAAKKAIDIIIKGQHPCGLWNYNCDGQDRNDTSYSGWCAQALKAAKMAGLDNDGLDNALRNAVAGFKFNFKGNIFQYESKGDIVNGCLTTVGTLCMQLLGANKQPEAKAGMDWLNQNATCDWLAPWGGNPIYYWYYLTQAKFHTGGDIWNQWNRQFAPQITLNQTIVKGAGLDGKDIGYWNGKDNLCKNYVYNTTLCTLMLEVYYRYLPTFKPVEEPKQEEVNKDNTGVTVTIN